MSTDPDFPHADPADVAEQQQDAIPPADDDEVPDTQPTEVPLEADEADVAEQRTDVPDWVLEDTDET